MTADPAAPSPWIKARRSAEGSDCVEMRRNGSSVQVRNSKHPHGDVLDVPPAQFTAWVQAARRGEFPVG